MSINVLLRLLVVVVLLSIGMVAASCSESESSPSPKSSPSSSPSPTTPAQQPSEPGWTVVPKTPEGEKVMQWDKPPEMMIDSNKQYRAIMETEHGKIVLELFTKDAPKTVNNFVFLATQGYYDGTTFHRVLKNFMVQGGDPTATGSGGPGYRFEDEFSSHGHEAGTLSMANSGANTNGSQFFICLEPQHHLDGHHSVFGQIVEGMDVLKSIKLRDPATAQTPGDTLISVTIEVKEGG